MTQLSSCSACDGFLPAAASVCPHCSASSSPSVALRVPRLPSARSPWSRLLKGGILVASSSALSLTMMACYGGPPCEEENDADGDGHYNEMCLGDTVDCNDDDATIYPGADDPEGDDIDQNCDGVDGVAPEGDAGPGGDGGDGDGDGDGDGGDGDSDAGVTDAG